MFFFTWWLDWVPEKKVWRQSMGLPDVHHKGCGGFEAWGWHGSDLPWEFIELSGEIWSSESESPWDKNWLARVAGWSAETAILFNISSNRWWTNMLGRNCFVLVRRGVLGLKHRNLETKKLLWQALRSPAVGSAGCSESESCRMEVAYFLGQRLIELWIYKIGIICF